MLNNIAAGNEELHEKLTDFLMSLILADKPYLLASAKGLDRAVNLAFVDPQVCDFILMIVFVFFSRWGASFSRYMHLVESLAFAVAGDAPFSPPGSQTTQRQVLVATPSEIHESLPDPALTQDLLLQNKWLSVLLLIHLFVGAPRAKRQKATRNEVQP
ncbi:hypothetical protein HDG34_003222 [Paraburkholderia sp. HC6.4b]|uniref:hypothetical protein n=1 Tax=Paraburkholderia sp. HC6.4b TaxID=2723095 RepID=UPI00161843B1|nr:hypothetical protein [Paraburkholderia sp. HC6.4b]MBB5409281.1 hypothetical protein [Paraburkholderia sp. HC6.4b]